MNTAPAKILIMVRGIIDVKNKPKTTAIKSTNRKPKIAPNIIGKNLLYLMYRARVQSCVLSPNSAKKTVPKVKSKGYSSVLHRHIFPLLQFKKFKIT